MIDWLVGIDTWLFLLLNVSLANPIFDNIMPIITNDWVLRALLAVIVIAMLVFGKRQDRIIALLCIATVALSDQTSSHLIKPIVERARPCHVVPEVHLLVACSNGLSFPSSHAANSFGIAVLMALMYRRRGWMFLALAALVSYSRIAVGVHYPFDVLAGAIVGSLCAIAIVSVYRLIIAQFGNPRTD